jgi:hypothetical protein
MKHSGMFRLADWEIITDVSKYGNAFVFTVKFAFSLLLVFDPECKGPTILKMPVTSHQYTQRNITQDLKLTNTFLVCHPNTIKR